MRQSSTDSCCIAPLKRIEGKAINVIGKTQFGFRKGMGTREAIGTMKMLCERSLEYGNDVYICFVDFEKAFDRVNCVKMMKILKSIGVDWRDRTSQKADKNIIYESRSSSKSQW